MAGMTATERTELGKLVRLNAKVAKDDAEARGKVLLADAEAKLAAVYKAEDEAWADIAAAAQKGVAEADATIAALCRERGIPEDLRPYMHCSFHGRGESAFAERRAELRRVAQARVAALVKSAQVEIDREAVSQLTTITRAGLTSDQARAFIGSMPKAEDLLPPLSELQLNNGAVVALLDPVAQVTPGGPGVTPKAVTDVTSNDQVVTPVRNSCAYCGTTFTPSRRDGKYCRPACRVADHRRRLKAASDAEVSLPPPAAEGEK